MLAMRHKRVGIGMWPQTQRCERHGWDCWCKGVCLTHGKGCRMEGVDCVVEECVKTAHFRENKWSAKCWVVTDSSRNVAQFRRLDGAGFFDKPELRMMTVGSPTWCLGASEIGARSYVILCEGGADMLAGYHFLAGLSMDHAVAVCCMLGGGNRIAGDCLPFFKGKLVRVLADADEPKVREQPQGQKVLMPGWEAARRWQEQLKGAGAVVETYDLFDLVTFDGRPVKDLNDMAKVNARTFTEENLAEAFTAWNF